MIIIDNEDIKVTQGEVRCVCDEWRSATLELNPASFGMCINMRYTIIVYYRNRNFNVAPPVLAATQTTLHDVIGRLENVDSPTLAVLNADEQRIAEHLTYQITLDEFARNRPDVLDFRTYAGSTKLHRVWYTLPLDRIPHNYTLHPMKARALTVAEFEAIADDSALISWLQNQVELFNNDYWKDQDFKSAYKSSLRQFVGDYINGDRHKTFDLTQYLPAPKPMEGLYNPIWANYFGKKRK